MSDKGPSSFEISNQISHSATSNPGSSKGVVGGGGSGIDGYMSTSINEYAKSANLSSTIPSANLDHMNPIGGKGIFSSSATEFIDEAGKMFVGNIDSGPMLATLQHEVSMEKAGLGNFSPGKQIGAEKGLSQGIVGRGGE